MLCILWFCLGNSSCHSKASLLAHPSPASCSQVPDCWLHKQEHTKSNGSNCFHILGEDASRGSTICLMLHIRRADSISLTSTQPKQMWTKLFYSLSLTVWRLRLEGWEWPWCWWRWLRLPVVLWSCWGWGWWVVTVMSACSVFTWFLGEAVVWLTSDGSVSLFVTMSFTVVKLAWGRWEEKQNTVLETAPSMV